MTKKIKILTLGDHPLSPSGVANQTRYFIDAMLKTGKFSFVSLGGAIQHQDYRPIRVEPYGVDWTIFPVDGYGTPEMIRSIIRTERPDVLWFMTDPRFYYWLWEMEDEIRPLIPMVYYHVWDNYPYPVYNEPLYASNDVIATISKVTDDIVRHVSPGTECVYLPHAVDTNIFKPLPNDVIKEFRANYFGPLKNKFVVFWNNRNAARKQSGSLLFWFKSFLDVVGHDKAAMLMHTQVKDPNGQDLEAIVHFLGLDKGQVMFSQEMIPPEHLSMLYNAADVTVNISDAEGFGLCLGSDSNIVTDHGSKFISDVEAGDMVLSMDGQYHLVLNKKSRKDVALKVKSRGNPAVLSSKDHPFYVRRGNEELWVKAENLKKGDYLACIKPTLKSDIPETIDLVEWIDDCEYNETHVWKKMSYNSHTNGLSISDICKKYNTTKHNAERIRAELLGPDAPKKQKAKYPGAGRKLYREFRSLFLANETSAINTQFGKVNRHINVTEDFLNMIGWYLAEGSNNDGSGLEFNFHSDEINVASRLKSSVKDLFGISTPVVVEKNKKNSCRMRLSGQILSEFFAKLCGVHAFNKRLHPVLMSSDVKTLRAVAGIFDGDGHLCRNKRSFSLSTTSQSMAWQVRNLLLCHDIFSCIGIHDKSPHNSSYRVSVSGKDYERFCHLIKTDKTQEMPIVRKAPEFYLRLNDKIFTEVMSVVDSGVEEDLFDIQIEGSKNFVANGVVVHNSTLESLACGTPIVVNKTGGLQQQVVDEFGNATGIGIEPCSRTVVGGQQVPFIYADRISEKDFVDALVEMFNMSAEDREKMSNYAIALINRQHSLEKYAADWEKLMLETNEKHGSWEERKLYKSWIMEEL